MHLKMSSAEGRLFSLGLNELMHFIEKKMPAFYILWPSDMVLDILRNTGSGNGLLPDSTKALPDWCWISWEALVQGMACFPTAPKHYLSGAGYIGKHWFREWLVA